MNPDHVHFAEWDAAYVLGALSPSDRRLFAEHAADCPICREAIAEVAPLMGLLARVDPERATSLADDSPREGGTDAAARARLVELGTLAARRRRRTWWAGAVAAAAALVVVVVIAVTIVADSVRGRDVVALEAVADVPLSASVELSEVAWGTRLELECRYDRTPTGSAKSWTYTLYVTSRDGASSEVSSWRASPGTTARLAAATALDSDEIAALEIRSADGDTVLMRTELAPPSDDRD